MKARNSTGVMVNIGAGQCTCTDGIAGVMHIDSFSPHSSDDPLRDLPADQGGLAYLGRVSVTLDGGFNRTLVADHYLKVKIHMLLTVLTSHSIHLPSSVRIHLAS